MFNNNESREQNAEVKVRPSPDSGLADSGEAMSNSGSPGHHLVQQGTIHKPGGQQEMIGLNRVKKGHK